MQRAASAAPLSPLHAAPLDATSLPPLDAARLSPLHNARLSPLQEEVPLASSPLTTFSDMGLSPEKSTSGNTERVMSEYINFDMTS